MLQVTPFEYDQISYNEAVDYLERTWQRRLTDHENHVLKWGYRIGRTVEMLDSWTKEGNHAGA